MTDQPFHAVGLNPQTLDKYSPAFIQKLISM